MSFSSKLFVPVLAAAAGLPILSGASGGTRAQPVEAPEIRLHGLVHQEGGGIALLQFGTGRPRALRPGEAHHGFTVMEILLDRVLLESPEGEAIRLHFPETALPPPPREWVEPVVPPDSLPPAEPAVSEALPEGSDPPLPPSTLAPGASGDSVQRLFSRDEVRLRLQTELPRILQTAVVAPRIQGNEVVGLELIAFPEDTVLAETGLAPGDVLLAVNGREVRGMESLVVLVQRFQTAREIELKVDRAGEPLSLRYRIE